jgi:glycerol kinase
MNPAFAQSGRGATRPASAGRRSASADRPGAAGYVGALDQGTTSTRFMVFDAAGREVARRQLEHRQILPRPGWVEHDPIEIAARVDETIAGALRAADLTGSDLAAIGITNQRETTVVWNPQNGRPWHNAIVWQDTRTDRIVAALEPARELLRARTGLPPATYFSATKVQWILDNVDGVRAAAERGEALFGTVDTWIIWNLTGGAGGGRHVTDATNASRTQLMDLRTLDWDDELLALFRIPRRMLPRICTSSDPSAFGATRSAGPMGAEVPIAGDLGDQHAALVGQACFAPGEAKNTYGTGNFMLLNTGSHVVPSSSGLLTTLAYRFAGGEPAYALEGSVAVTGSAVQWLRDQLEVIKSADEIETLAASVPDSAGMYFVPAFSGLFAPYWRADARGVIVGLSRFHTKAHLARATLEAICFQTRAVLDAMARDAGVHLQVLKVDGGATVNALLMQMQADILGVPVVRPVVAETTALGAAYAAGLAVGFWPDLETLRRQWKADREWQPQWSQARRDEAFHGWQKAVERSYAWVEHGQTGR